MKRHLLLPALLLAAFVHAAPPDNPDPAQPPSLRGAWRAYVSRSDVIVARTDTRYVFGNMGWALLPPNGPVHQDRYQIHDGKLYLYPNPKSVPEGFDPKTSALVATLDLLPDGTVRAFSLPDPTQPGRAIRCEREPSLPELSPQSLAGSYTIVQRRLGTDDTRGALHPHAHRPKDLHACRRDSPRRDLRHRHLCHPRVVAYPHAGCTFPRILGQSHLLSPWRSPRP